MKITKNVHAFLWQSMTENNCNAYLINGPTPILIDPGHVRLFHHVEKGLEALGVSLNDIGLVICTHAHPDHIEGVRLFNRQTTRIAFHESAWQLIKNMGRQAGLHSNKEQNAYAPDFFLKEGVLDIDGIELSIIHTPGHSPGSISIYWPDNRSLFTGDLIFQEGVGRTDLPGGDGQQLKASIQRLRDLDVEYLLPGHGEIVSGKSAVKRNFDSVVDYWFAYI
jgi:glyoxylase-like metal-dependent hydrolase (beta-lactamase superfamily II)